MRDGRLQPDDTPASVERVMVPPNDAFIAELLHETQSAAQRDAGGHAKRTDREILAFALMDEKIDQHLPGGITEQTRAPDQLLPQQAPVHMDLRIRERDCEIAFVPRSRWGP